jgi:aconitate hydratase
MTQKILGGRADGQPLGADLVRARVDQVVLSRDPEHVLAEALRFGLKRAAVETAVAYDTQCGGIGQQADHHRLWLRELLQYNIFIARPGIGFPVAVHLERFASPGRLALTDDARGAAIGGAGTLALQCGPRSLAEALVTGWTIVRIPRTVQVLLSGRLRPFVSVRDIALELMRLGLSDVIRRLDACHGAPVVLEFAGPSARSLSVYDRALLASLAPRVGAAGALFVSDEKTEVFLRDQRRSKAHRALVPDPGAPCDEAISLDLSAIDPLVMDQQGRVSAVRELQGTPIRQAVLGGDCGASLRDLLVAAALLKSKRVPPRLDLLLAPPSRQTLEILARSGALVDLIATGARLLEPDARLMSGELYPPPEGGLSVRTFDPEPDALGRSGSAVASAETVAYSVAFGALGDPRSFKRPVRVTLPRYSPTDEVLLVRRTKPKVRARQDGESERAIPEAPARPPWRKAVTLQPVTGERPLTEPTLLVLGSWQQARWAVRHAARLLPELRAVVAPQIPGHAVAVLASLGILACTADPESIAKLEHNGSVTVPPSDRWAEDGTIAVSSASGRSDLRWLAIGPEREWTLGEPPASGPPAPMRPACDG